MTEEMKNHLYHTIHILNRLYKSCACSSEVEELKKNVEQFGWETIKKFNIEYMAVSTDRVELIDQLEQSEDWEVMKVVADLTGNLSKFPRFELRSFPDQLSNPDTRTIIQQYLSQTECSLDPNSFKRLIEPFQVLEEVNELVQYYQNNQLYAASGEFMKLLEQSFCVPPLKDYHDRSIYQDSTLQIQKLEWYTHRIKNFWEIMECPEVWERFLDFERYVKENGFQLGDCPTNTPSTKQKSKTEQLYPSDWKTDKKLPLFDILYFYYQGFSILLNYLTPCDLMEEPLLSEANYCYLASPEKMQNAIKIIQTLQKKRQEQDQIYAYFKKSYKKDPNIMEDIQRAVYQLDQPQKVTFGAFRPFVENAIATDHLCEYLQQKDCGFGYFLETQTDEVPDYYKVLEVIKEKERDPLWQFSENKKFDMKSISDLYSGFCSEKFYQKYKKENQLETYIFTKKRKRKW